MTLHLGEQVRSILCLGAHADDIEIGCGATLAALIAARPYLHIQWVVLSADSVRAEEAKRSAGVYLGGLSSSSFEVQAFRDSYFPSQYGEIKDYMHGLQRQHMPDLIFTHRQEDQHQDHRLVSELTRSVFRGPLVLEYEIPKFDGDLAGMNLLVPCTVEGGDQKIDRLKRCFPSQAERYWFEDEVFRGHLRMRGIECGPATKYAEAFFLRKSTLVIN